jgi:serine/threonine protein kinase/Tol biopolymer transport system component
MIGATISHFRILEKLGEGGMGVVYKAEDTNLKRTVALKFLPRGLEAHEPERARFLQEAQAASAINHANVCTIYEISQHEDPAYADAPAGRQQFIVMEYVDGKTLRELIVNHQLSIDNCIGYAIQIGEALQEAHSKGIVHRDIKTDNIMVNSRNQIKVMDFGLAKLKGSLKLTKTSSTVGTLAYMAPEQIEGGEVDARSDIFSFGVVLYEMLTGHLPFRGEHEAAMVYSIVNEEPIPVQKHLPEISSEVVHILNRALEKDPEDRYQTVHDMVIDLRRLKKQTSKVSRAVPTVDPSGGVSESTREPSEGSPRGSKKRLTIIVVSSLVIVCAAVVILTMFRGLQINPDMRSQVLSLPFRDVRYADMSKDGNWVVFPAADDRGRFDVYMMNLSGGQPRRVTADSCYNILYSAISPDASTILYRRRRTTSDPWEIVSVSSSGGGGRVLMENVLLGGWLPDGKRFCYVVTKQLPRSRRTDEVWTAKPDGSDRQFVFADTTDIRPGLRMGGVYSPDGRSFAWTKNFKEGYSEIMIHDVEKGTVRQLTFDKKFADDPLWSPTGHIIYSSNRGGNVNLWVLPAAGGEPTQLTRGSGYDQRLGITADGKRLLYSEMQENIGQIKIGNLGDGSVRQLTVDDRARANPSFSPSGRQIMFAAQEIDAISSVRNIFVMDREGGNVRKLTDDMTFKTSPSWSPDEKWITYAACSTTEPIDSTRVYLIQADKPGQPTMIGYGTGPRWFNEKEFIFERSLITYKGSIDRTGVERFSEDSVWAFPVFGGKHVAIYDYRQARRGAWVTTMFSFKSLGTKEARQVIKGFSYRGGFGRNEYFYVPLGSSELHRMSVDGRDSRVKGKFPGLAPSFDFDVSSDGKEIVYTEYYWKAKFVLIDNLFK